MTPALARFCPTEYRREELRKCLPLLFRKSDAVRPMITEDPATKAFLFQHDWISFLVKNPSFRPQILSGSPSHIGLQPTQGDFLAVKSVIELERTRIPIG